MSLNNLKTSRCKFFTLQGQPLKPYCKRSDATCRYLHPSDAKWKTTHPYKYNTSSNTPNAPKAIRMNNRVTNDVPNPLSARGVYSSPRLSQSDLFRLTVDDDFSTLQSSHDDAEGVGGRGRQFSRLEYSVEDSAERLNAGAVAGGSHSARKVGSGAPNLNKAPNTRFDSSSKKKKRTSRRSSSLRSVGGHSARIVNNISNERTHREKIIEVFKRLASLSNQTIQNTAALSQGENKLQNFTELSSTLSKISSSAAKMVAPTLADITSHRALCKERVEKDLVDLELLWEEIFDVFVQGITPVLDKGVQDALSTLKTEGERASLKWVKEMDGSRQMKRKVTGTAPTSSSGSLDPGSVSSQGYGENTPCHKRRRLLVSSSFDDRADSESELKVDDKEDTFLSMLQEMKSQIDSQAQNLKFLTEENSQLKASLNLYNLGRPAGFPQSLSSHQGSALVSCGFEPEQSEGIQYSQSLDSEELRAVEFVLEDQRFTESPPLRDLQNSFGHSFAPR